jgi:integrase
MRQIWDTGLKAEHGAGMASIIRRGERQWQVRVRRKSIRAGATFETKARAIVWARQVEAQIDAGRFQSGMLEAERITLHQALDRYLVEIVARKKGVRQNTGIVRAWQRGPLAQKSLASIRSSDIASWRDAKLKHVGPQTVLHHLNVLSHLYRVAIADWGLETLANPVARINKPAVPRGRERRLRGDEERKLLVACNASASIWLGPLIRLALATAMRQSELVGLCWPQITLADRTILLKDTKNGEPRTVPLSTAAVQVLSSICSTDREKVFSIQTGRAVSHAFSKACKVAGILDLRFHDLRHEATSRLFENTNLRDVEIASITGHKSMEMLKRYAHLRSAQLAMRLG